MAKRSTLSSRWLAEHESDPYVKAARAEGYRSRAVYKLEEIQRTDKIIQGTTIVDLGAALGRWSRYAANLLRTKDGHAGRIVASVILPMGAN